MTSYRIEACVCGGPDIKSPSLKDAQVHVDIHNAGPVHTAWRLTHQAKEHYAYELRRLDDEKGASPIPYRDPRRPTAGAQPVDLVQEGDSGASASEGAA